MAAFHNQHRVTSCKNWWIRSWKGLDKLPEWLWMCSTVRDRLGSDTCHAVCCRYGERAPNGWMEQICHLSLSSLTEYNTHSQQLLSSGHRRTKNKCFHLRKCPSLSWKSYLYFICNKLLVLLSLNFDSDNLTPSIDIYIRVVDNTTAVEYRRLRRTESWDQRQKCHLGSLCGPEYAKNQCVEVWGMYESLKWTAVLEKGWRPF